MEFKSINPYNNKEVGTYVSLTKVELDEKLDRAHAAFLSWKKVPLEERVELMKKAGQVLRDNVDRYAEMITLEMGKPIKQSQAEMCCSQSEILPDHQSQ